MRGGHIAVRATLVCGAAGIICALWAATDDTAARASDRPTGPLTAAVDGLADTVEQLPHQTTELTKAAARAPERVTSAPEPVEQVRSTVVHTLQSLTEAPRPDAVAPPAPVAPARADAPTPAAPQAVPAVVLLAGPGPNTTTPTAGVIAPAAAYTLPCRAAFGTIPPRPGDLAAPAGCTPDDPSADGLAPVKPPPKTGADQLAATTPTGPATPALRLLGELLPRSDLPTGRTTKPEPGPA